MEASQAESRPFIDVGRLRRSEYLGFVAAVVLVGSLFLPWFSTVGNGTINGLRGEFSAFGTFAVLPWVLIAAASAPFILAYIIARGHELTWRPGEVTMIVGMTAFVLIFINAIVLGKPSEPPSESTIEIGWFVGLAAAAGIAISGFVRQAEGIKKKPPGV